MTRTVAEETRPLPQVEGVSPSARALLEVGVTLFAERGYHGVSIRELTGSLDMTPASFYAHFASKEDLLYQLLLLGHERHQASVREAVLEAGTDPADQLREAIRANVLFHGTYPLMTIVGNTDLHALTPEHQTQIYGMRHQSGVLVASVLARGIESGAFSCQHPWLAMSAIAGMGVRVAWWFREEQSTAPSPLSSYPREAMGWLDRSFSLEEIADEYASYALKIVS